MLHLAKKIFLVCLALSLPIAVQAQPKEEPKPGEQRVFEVGNGVKMTFCWIPGTNGKVTLGSPKNEVERGKDEDEHQVELDGFWLARTEMTQSQYVKLTGKKNPSYFCAESGGEERVKGENTADFPVEYVSWEDAQACIKKMKAPSGMKRIGLPSEAQWEWACRGGRGNDRPFYFGNTLDGKEANCNGEYAYGTPLVGPLRRQLRGPFLRRTSKVGAYFAVHPWGLQDMHGNVWEWCEDYYGPYEKLPSGKNPVQTIKQSSDLGVLRGGGWDSSSGRCRSASRYYYPQFGGLANGGLRVCLCVD